MDWVSISFLLSMWFKCSSQLDWTKDVLVRETPFRFNMHYHKIYFFESAIKISKLNDIRFLHEVSPHYESGYLIGELMERYRKMVELVRWSFQYVGEENNLKMKKINQLITLYLEIYHLTHMLHEIPQKYKDDPEFSNIEQPLTFEQIMQAHKGKLHLLKQRERQKKRDAMFLKKMRNSYLEQGIIYKPEKKKIKNPWPLEYGWEIDDYWFNMGPQHNNG